jgi:flagellar hook-associated protein FlgK
MQSQDSNRNEIARLDAQISELNKTIAELQADGHVTDDAVIQRDKLMERLAILIRTNGGQ